MRELERNRWYGIIQRCENPRHISYARYGAKGIGICPRWRASFDAFLADVGRAPTPRHTIDRIDPTKGYEPGNVRWATMQEQQRNRLNNRVVEIDGRRVTQAELVEMTGLSQGTVATRMRNGWTVERIMQTPPALPPSQRTTCPKGHPYSGDNLAFERDGSRKCRECARAVNRRYRGSL